MKAARTLWLRSSGPGARFIRKVAITPSRNTTVDLVCRAMSQKRSVEKDSISATDAPRASITNGGPMPPIWKIGATHM